MDLDRECFWGAIGAAILTLWSGWSLYRFAEKPMNPVSLIAAVVGILLSMSIVAVIPFDVWHSLMKSDGQQEAGDSDMIWLLNRSWSANYWTTLLTTTLTIPILMEFEAAGEFSTVARLRTACRRLVMCWTIYVVLGVIILVWLIINGKVDGSLESWCIAVSNAWGMLVLTILMGFGLVGVPRNFWRLADPAEQLKSRYISAVAKDEQRLSRIFELQDAISQVRSELALVCSFSHSGEMDPTAIARLRLTLLDCERLQKQLAPCRNEADDGGSECCQSTSATSGDAEDSVPESATSSALTTPRLVQAMNVARGLPETPLERLARVHRGLKAAALEARRAVTRWDSHVERCLFYEDLHRRHFKAAAEMLSRRPRLGLPAGPCSHLRSLVWLVCHTLLVFWLRNVRSRALRFLSTCCAILSSVIVLGQLTLFHDGISLSVLSLFFHHDHGPWTTQVLCAIPLGYMVYTAYFSIFRLKIPGWYGIYGNHSTDMGSLLWGASMVARLAAPMCYNFLLLIHVQDTSFQNFMGRMKVVPVLGCSFTMQFPRIIALLCVFNIFNVYGRVVRLLTLGAVDFDLAGGENGEDPLSEGKQLIERERRRRSEVTRAAAGNQLNGSRDDYELSASGRLDDLPPSERLAVPFAGGDQS